MDYKKIYDVLCHSRKHRPLIKEVGYEIHHIIPRSMGGDDTGSNLVKLSYKEHFVAHKLLYKFTTGYDNIMMSLAYTFMIKHRGYKVYNSTSYSLLKYRGDTGRLLLGYRSRVEKNLIILKALNIYHFIVWL